MADDVEEPAGGDEGTAAEAEGAEAPVLDPEQDQDVSELSIDESPEAHIRRVLSGEGEAAGDAGEGEAAGEAGEGDPGAAGEAEGEPGSPGAG